MSLAAAGSFSYVPAAGYVGTDQFTYSAAVPGYQTAPITVTITVTPPPLPVVTAVAPNQGPVAGGTAVTITGSPDRYTYNPPPPTVTAVAPTHGPAAGGTTVTITGTDIAGTTAVTFGTEPATNVTVVNAHHGHRDRASRRGHR